MATIAHIVEKLVETRPFLEEALSRGIINYAALSETLAPGIERELRKPIKPSAVMMALRRLAEKLGSKQMMKAAIRFKDTDLTAKSDLFELTVVKSPAVLECVKKLYGYVDPSRGDFLTVTHGICEVTIISNKKYTSTIHKLFERQRIVKVIDHLSSLTIKIPPGAVEQVGLFYIATKALNWENINIIEIVSTLTEMTFILREKDIARAFTVLKELIDGQE